MVGRVLESRSDPQQHRFAEWPANDIHADGQSCWGGPDKNRRLPVAARVGASTAAAWSRPCGRRRWRVRIMDTIIDLGGKARGDSDCGEALLPQK